MPTLIANYQKKVIATQLKKGYSAIAQAIKLSESQNEELENWDFSLSGTDFYYKYLQKYLIQNKEIATRQEYTVKNLNGTNCTSEAWCVNNDNFYVYLSDGSIMGVMTSRNQTKYKAITIDINGLKKPNTLGKDLFVFSIIQPDGLVPYGYKTGGVNNYNKLDKAILTNQSDYACNKQNKGIWCSALIMLDNWEITKDYPW